MSGVLQVIQRIFQVADLFIISSQIKITILIILDKFQGVKLASSTDRGTYSMGSPAKGKGKVADFGSDPSRATFTLVVNELKTYVYVNDIYYGEYKLLDYRITNFGPVG